MSCELYWPAPVGIYLYFPLLSKLLCVCGPLKIICTISNTVLVCMYDVCELEGSKMNVWDIMRGSVDHV